MKKILIIGMLLLIGGCAVQVKTHQNPRVDFSGYSSWCWMRGCEIVYQGPEYYFSREAFDEISNAIAWNMNSKGYFQTDDRSDLIMNFYVILNQDSVEVRSIDDLMMEGDREWLKISYPEYQQFLKGSLVIDVVDRRSSELIWTSTAVRYMEINPTYDKDKIWSGVKRAMKKFPTKEEIDLDSNQ